MTHIDQRIRDWLAEADHENWCNTQVFVVGFIEKGCNCVLGSAKAAIAAVLDLPVAVAMRRGLPDRATGYNIALDDARRAIATQARHHPGGHAMTEPDDRSWIEAIRTRAEATPEVTA